MGDAVVCKVPAAKRVSAKQKEKQKEAEKKKLEKEAEKQRKQQRKEAKKGTANDLASDGRGKYITVRNTSPGQRLRQRRAMRRRLP